METTRVVFVTREGRTLPGARVRCYNFAARLREHGIRAEVFSFADTLGAKDGEQESQLTAREKVLLNLRAFNALRRIKGALLVVQRFNYHSLAPWCAHHLCGTPFLFDLDDWEMREDPRYYFRFFPASKAHYCTRVIARQSAACTAASRFLQELLLPWNASTHYLPSGVDTAFFAPRVPQRDDGRVVFSWIGTLHKREYVENIAFALECFRVVRERHRDVFFEILADGIYRNELRQLMGQSFSSGVTVKEWLPWESVPAYLDTVSIGLYPVARKTKFNLSKSPTKLFEYMAMAKPAVAGAIGEPLHVIRDGENGFLASSQEECIVKMERLVRDPSLRGRIGDEARRSVIKDYSLAVVGERLSRIIREL